MVQLQSILKSSNNSILDSGNILTVQVDDNKPWQRVHTDSTGRRQLASSTGNKCFTVFACAHTGRKLFFAHKKRKHFQLVYMEFVEKIGQLPAVLKYLIAKRVSITLLPRAMNTLLMGHPTKQYKKLTMR